jgi:3-oxoacyl-[acyl-carrier protein] reductase
MSKLTGKVAVVTGASKGIGAGIAKALAAEGAAVVVNYASSKDGAEKVVAEIKNDGGKAIAIQGDVSKAGDITKLFAETKKAYGHVDILVNNAGVYEFLPLEAVTEEHFHRLYNINVLGLILTTQEAVKHFPTGGGSVINIGSAAAIATPPASVVYSSTKGAVNVITGVLAKELGPRGIRVNALNPGPVETEGFISTGFKGSDFEKGMIAQTPLGRVGQPDDIGPVAAFLASDDAKWLTGETIYASGGLKS